MNNAARSISTSAKYHGVRFYESDRSLAIIVADFLTDGLAAGDPAVIVAIPARRAAILRELAARGWDVVELQHTGQLVLGDAEATLSTFMTDGTPDAERFRTSMCEVMHRACRGRKDCTLRIYGEMVNALWESGQKGAAITLEMLWNQLAASESFSLLCGYAIGHFYKEVDVDQVCGHHTHVVSTNGESVEVAR